MGSNQYGACGWTAKTGLDLSEIVLPIHQVYVNLIIPYLEDWLEEAVFGAYISISIDLSLQQADQQAIDTLEHEQAMEGYLQKGRGSAAPGMLDASIQPAVSTYKKKGFVCLIFRQ